jgi:two-component system, OmpR family, sensor kinase
VIRRLVVSYVALVAVALAAFSVPVGVYLSDQLIEDQEQRVRRDAHAIAVLLGAGASDASVQVLAREVERESGGVVTVRRRGADAAAGQPAARALTAALRGREVTERVEDPALGRDGVAVALPARDRRGAVVGAVRVVEPDDEREDRLASIWTYRAVLAAGVLAAAALLGLSLARRLTRPMRELGRMATRVGQGDLHARAHETGPPEVRDLARTLNDTAGRLDALLTSQRAFVADASHQLRTPLAALHIWLDNAADAADSADTRHDLDRARQEVARMDRLVGGLLALARAEAAAGSRQTVAVAEVVADRIQAWQAAASAASATIAQRVPAGIRAQLRPGTLEQVLDNLLENAIGVGAAEVVVSAEQVDGRVVLAVADDGPGLSPNERARAFDRFWRGPRADSRAGSGLGLAIVRQLIEDDGGSVTLAPTASGGLEVRLSLPREVR